MTREETLRSITKEGLENLREAFDEKLEQIITTLKKDYEESTEIKKSDEGSDNGPSQIASLRTEMDQTIRQLEERLDRRLSSLDTRVNLLPLLRPGEDRFTFRPEQQQPVLDCLNVLTEVEKLVLQKRNLAQSNTALVRKRDDAQMQPRLAPLPSALQHRITALLEEFTYTTPEEEFKERIDRFWDCRDLRRAILEYFASLPPVVPTTQTS